MERWAAFCRTSRRALTARGRSIPGVSGDSRGERLRTARGINNWRGNGGSTPPRNPKRRLFDWQQLESGQCRASVKPIIRDYYQWHQEHRRKFGIPCGFCFSEAPETKRQPTETAFNTREKKGLDNALELIEGWYGEHPNQPHH